MLNIYQKYLPFLALFILLALCISTGVIFSSNNFLLCILYCRSANDEFAQFFSALACLRISFCLCFLKLNFLFEIIVDLCTVLSNSTEGSCVPFTQFPPIVNSCKTIVLKAWDIHQDLSTLAGPVSQYLPSAVHVLWALCSAFSFPEYSLLGFLRSCPQELAKDSRGILCWVFGARFQVPPLWNSAPLEFNHSGNY